MSMTYDEKRAALVAAGYKVSIHIYRVGDEYHSDSLIYTPDDAVYQYVTYYHGQGKPKAEIEAGVHALIDKAYAHLQREEERVALRRFVLSVHREAEKIKVFSGQWSDPIESTFANLLMTAYRSWAYIEKYNITDNTEESNAP